MAITAWNMSCNSITFHCDFKKTRTLLGFALDAQTRVTPRLHFSASICAHGAHLPSDPLRGRHLVHSVVLQRPYF